MGGGGDGGSRGFQSHAGSIEADSPDFELNYTFLFQSHAGSIEAAPPPFFFWEGNMVSIPRWFD